VLSLNNNRLGPAAAVGQALGRALRASALPGLKGLEVAHAHLGPAGSRDVAAALGEGECPLLEVVHLLSTGADEGAAVSLLEGLAGGRLPRLRVVSLSEVGTAAATLAEAMEEGQCALLEQLSLYQSRVSHGDARRLVERLAGGACPRLEKLTFADMGEAFGGGVLVSLIQALRQGACPQLRDLSLWSMGMDNEACVGLARAMEAGGMPRLERLIIFCNRGIGPAGVSAITAALRAGGAPELKRLDMTQCGLRGLSEVC
jgi:Ran GTPase-activating protein (RanGAP) involved in mRNA processing and transport